MFDRKLLLLLLLLLLLMMMISDYYQLVQLYIRQHSPAPIP